MQGLQRAAPGAGMLNGIRSRAMRRRVTTPRPAQQVALDEASCFNVRNNQVNDWMTQTPQAKTTV
ncbi:MAG: hypothetical protein P8179_02695, partial [Candidatus Thiodiazotropha sp.]